MFVNNQIVNEWMPDLGFINNVSSSDGSPWCHEPNDYPEPNGTDINCIMLSHNCDYKWNDIDCDAGSFYPICNYPIIVDDKCSLWKYSSAYRYNTEAKVTGVTSWGICLNEPAIYHQSIGNFSWITEDKTTTNIIVGDKADYYNENSCPPFNLDDDDYINGYRVLYGRCIYGITFYTKYNKSYHCIADDIQSTYFDSGIVLHENQYLSGFWFDSGPVIAGIQFLFTNVSHDTSVPTSNPTVKPTIQPTSNPSTTPTIQPSSTPSIKPSQSPSTSAPSVNLAVLPTIYLSSTIESENRGDMDTTDQSDPENKSSHSKNLLTLIIIICASLVCIVCMIMIISIVRLIPKMIERQGDKNDQLEMQNAEMQQIQIQLASPIPAHQLHLGQIPSASHSSQIIQASDKKDMHQQGYVVAIQGNTPYFIDDDISEDEKSENKMTSRGFPMRRNIKLPKLQSRMSEIKEPVLEEAVYGEGLRDVEDWLKSLDLSRDYMDCFGLNGYESLDMLREIVSDQDLRDIGIVDQQDINTLRLGIEALKTKQ